MACLTEAHIVFKRVGNVVRVPPEKVKVEMENEGGYGKGC